MTRKPRRKRGESNDESTLQRATFRTSRLLDFASEKELIAQTGHQPDVWPLVIAKELVDNGIDSCEEAGIAPIITVAADANGITVTDNGPGLPPETVEGILDFNVRVSSREAYVSPRVGRRVMR
ncbi:MAG: ATP-binding protein [Methyloceanibacter sp.]